MSVLLIRYSQAFIEIIDAPYDFGGPISGLISLVEMLARHDVIVLIKACLCILICSIIRVVCNFAGQCLDYSPIICKF